MDISMNSNIGLKIKDEAIKLGYENCGIIQIPKHLNGLIAKYYLVDSRKDENSIDYQASILFENYLNELGLKTATKRDFGITDLRWAALKAGLGIVRKNNFFYSDS